MYKTFVLYNLLLLLYFALCTHGWRKQSSISQDLLERLFKRFFYGQQQKAEHMRTAGLYLCVFFKKKSHLDLKVCLLLYLNIFRTLNQCSLWPWEESVAPSSRPSSHWPPSRMCSRFRCQVAGSTTSALSQQPQLAARDSPVVPAPALYRQVTSKQTF